MRAKKIRAPLGIQVRAVDHDKRTIRFVASDESVDRYGTVVSVKGWNLQMYRKNPIFLFGHDYRSPWAVMGRAVRIEKDTANGELVMDMLFMEKDLNPIAEMVYQMYAHRPPFLNAVSVGFIPLKMEEVKDLDQDKMKQAGPKRKAVLKFTEQELLELSAVTVPANANAVGKGTSVARALDYLNSLKDEGLDPVQLMAAQTVLSDDSERGQLQERMECWMEQNGLMVPCSCNVRDMVEVSTFARDYKNEVLVTRDVSLQDENLEDLEEAIRRDAGEERAGAVLNAKNKGALREALSLIQNVLDSAGDAADEDDNSEQNGLTERINKLEHQLSHIADTVEDCYELLRANQIDEDADDGTADDGDIPADPQVLNTLDSILDQVRVADEKRAAAVPEILVEHESLTRLAQTMKRLSGAKRRT